MQSFCCCLIFTGTNAGEAFGQLGIGVYGKTWLTRGKKLRVQFMYRARRIDKNVQVVRLSVDSHEDADNVIRDWLRSKRKRKRPAQKKTTEPASDVIHAANRQKYFCHIVPRISKPHETRLCSWG